MSFDFLAVRNRSAPTSTLYPDLGALPGHIEGEPDEGGRIPLTIERVVVQRYDGSQWNDIADLDAPGRIGTTLTDSRVFLVSEAVDALEPSAISVPPEGHAVAQCRHQWVARLEYALPGEPGEQAIVGAQAFDGTAADLAAIRFLLYLPVGVDPREIAIQWLDRIVRHRLQEPTTDTATAAELRQPRTFQQLAGGATMLVEIPGAEEAVDVAAGAAPDPTAALRPAPAATLPPPPAETRTHASVFDGRPAVQAPPPAPGTAPTPVGPPPLRASARSGSRTTLVAWLVGVLVLAAAAVGLALALSGDGGDGNDTVAGDDGADDTSGGDGTGDGDGADEPADDSTGDDGGVDPNELLSQANEAVTASTVTIDMIGCQRGTVASGLLIGPDLIVTSAQNAPLLFASRVHIAGADGPAVGRPAAFDDDLMALRLDGRSGTSVALGETTPAVGDAVVVIGRTNVGSTLVLPLPGTVTAVADNVVITLTNDVDESLLGAPVVAAGPALVGVVTSLDGVAVTVTPLRPVDVNGGAPTLPPCADTSVGSAPGADVAYNDPSIEALLKAQQLASALADADWNLVRSLEPGKAGFTDAQFENGWGLLERSTIVPVRTLDAGDTDFGFRLGLVAHESDNGSQITRVFCVNWRVDLEAGTLVQTGVNSQQLGDPDAPLLGHVDPAGLVPQIRDEC